MLLPEGTILPEECIEAANGDELIAGILYRRGIKDPEDVKKFINQDYYNSFNPSDLECMQEATLSILSKADDGANVCIYGDYDVDGITSTVLLKEALTPFFDNVICHIPHRFTEGYGMNSDVIRDLKDNNIDLIITCDCGISNIDEIKLARDIGMDVIITDHHTPPEILPPANVILNPKLYGDTHPLYFLPGVGVAYMLIMSLYERSGRSIYEGQWLDLVALGIIADVVPVIGECRYLLKKGLPYLINPDRIGLKALYSVLNSNNCTVEDEEDIAFQIAPRINAAGRMDNPYLPLKLLLEQNWDRALENAMELDSLNSRRKTLQNYMYEQAVQIVEEEQRDEGIFVLYNASWHEGVLGIVAGKVAEQYRRPCICLTLKDDGFTATGSARSVGNVSIYELLVDSEDYLLKFGGHKQAAGMSLNVEKLELFTRHIQALLPKEKGIQKDLIDVDVEASISAMDNTMLRRIDKLAPFGHAFSKPVFVSRNVDIVSNRVIGKNHRRLILSSDGTQVEGIWWWAPSIGDEWDELKKVDVVYTLSQNRGRVLLTVLHMKCSKKQELRPPTFDRHIQWYDLRRQPIDKILKTCPDIPIYYEGLEKISKNVITRYEISKCERLLLISAPPAPAILRELIVLSGANEVILGFQGDDFLNINQFMRQLQAILKHVIQNRNGVTTIQALSSLMCAPEELIEIALLYLKDAGFIDYIWEDMGEVIICRGKGSNGLPNRQIEELLHNSFHEMIAFKRYINSRELATIDSLLRSYTDNQY